MNPQPEPRVVKLPGQHRRKLAAALLSKHPLHSAAPPPSKHTASKHIRVVCISDTHNHQPELPAGDLLIHAGDLTEHGSFDELQTQLAWLSSQPHRYKVVIAGNHDVLLDEEFLAKYPERDYPENRGRSMRDLDWGSVRYLCNESITLEFDGATSHENEDNTQPPTMMATEKPKKLTIYGSPLTPQYGISAFQYPRDRMDVWSSQNIPADTDILITHGAPRFHLDKRDFHRAGCPYLAREIARLRPRLVVFGHIHASYGREDDVVMDGVRRRYEDVLGNLGGWMTLICMLVGVLWAWVVKSFSVGGAEGMRRGEKLTTFVNASVVGGSDNEVRNEAVVVDL